MGGEGGLDSSLVIIDNFKAVIVAQDEQQKDLSSKLGAAEAARDTAQVLTWPSPSLLPLPSP